LATLKTPVVSQFSGFTKKTIDFLDQVHRRNSKTWFEEHRDVYEQHVLHPFRNLAAALSPAISEIDPAMETNPLRVVSRIHRDIRFSHDKSLYKRSMWLTFKRRIEEWQDSPAFYFEVSPDLYRFGMGYYDVSRETMDCLRQMIEKKPALVRKQLAAIDKIPGMAVEGQAYKRTINPEIPEEFLPIYQKKELYLVANRKIDDLVFSAALVADLEACFRKMADFYRFLRDLKTG
jgi:uncharacterized protein (TIGR02453 family)